MEDSVEEESGVSVVWACEEASGCLSSDDSVASDEDDVARYSMSKVYSTCDVYYCDAPSGESDYDA